MSSTREHPHHLRIGAPTSRVTVSRDGIVLADTTHAIALHEGSLPVRYYIPAEDVRVELLTPSDHASHCPFKGDASYWSVDGDPDIAWTYPQPIPGAEPIAGRIAFFNERVDISTDDG